MKHMMLIIGAGMTLASAAVAGNWQEQDANGDGQITKAEFDTAVAAGWSRLDANRDGQVTAQEAGDKMAKLATADANGDGQISQSEFTAKKTEWWAKADADGNGSVSREEFAAASGADRNTPSR